MTWLLKQFGADLLIKVLLGFVLLGMPAAYVAHKVSVHVAHEDGVTAGKKEFKDAADRVAKVERERQAAAAIVAQKKRDEEERAWRDQVLLAEGKSKVLAAKLAEIDAQNKTLKARPVCWSKGVVKIANATTPKLPKGGK